MIGVVAEEKDYPAVREFFELFKTPWQFYREGLHCDVLICTESEIPSNCARLVLNYRAGENAHETAVLKAGADRIPIYGKCRTFRASKSDALVDESSGAPVLKEDSSGRQTVIQIGFDLFAEIRHLLTRGQPVEHALIPTLDLHIAFLRALLVRHDLSVIEIPPVPVGHDFIACLTHDVDHPRLRDHLGDHTMFGFLQRALLGSLLAFVRGRKTLRQVAQNYLAVFSLPLVYLGFAKDFWNQFARYRAIEGDAKSTFFVIPEKGNPGQDAQGRRQSKRSAGYDLASIASELRRLISDGCEVAVHGIDAWRDSIKGRTESEKVRQLTGADEIGIRMHWLYFSDASAFKLEAAGYSYDSTSGYNDAVGYRAGTVQAFRPLDCKRLLELPMQVMDTAMFYPSYLNLSLGEAAARMDRLIANAVRFGGVLTINWHDRSLAPERQWDDSYINLLEKLKGRGAWMPTAADAVSWFRQRRAARIDEASGKILLEQRDERLPGLRLSSRHSAGSAESIPVDDYQSEPTLREVSAA